MRIRDPVHGTIEVSPEERVVLDSRFYQRLRHVKQLGFGEMAFPGATHTRHAHCLGAMHVSSRLFDAVAASSDLPPPVRARFRAAVRLSLLCHDLGHMPRSHSSEEIAPQRARLSLPAWVLEATPEAAGRAAHEDFTVKILLDSSLTPTLRQTLSQSDLAPEALAGLIVGAPAPGFAAAFTYGGVDWMPLLRALVSGELDADRMDYLLRDSLFTGVDYGRYDLEWLAQNLHPAIRDGKAHLALSRSAVFAFEDFLLSRYHMSVSVYLHHTSVGFDQLLIRYYADSPGEFEIPADPEAFVDCDDVALDAALRASKNPWARRIVERRPFKLLFQFTERDEGYDLPALLEALTAAKISHFAAESQGVLSKYFQRGEGPGLYILDESTGRLTEVARYTPLYQRYSGAVRLSRVYVAPEQADAARGLLRKLAYLHW